MTALAAKEHNAFDIAAARARCKRHRKRILEMTQSVSALHVGGAFWGLVAAGAVMGVKRLGMAWNPPPKPAP